MSDEDDEIRKLLHHRATINLMLLLGLGIVLLAVLLMALGGAD